MQAADQWRIQEFVLGRALQNVQLVAKGVGFGEGDSSPMLRIFLEIDVEVMSFGDI